ncbi:hypothetical protein GGI21_002305 [Coemansia aciculifera]|nr:hypothetical protein GGI21_002305 [Coemansia aciculifera]
MPNYQVVRCASDDCAKFQSQQEKKTNKWACVVCGLKQSVRRVYFQSTAPKECRSVVMELNMNRGQAESERLNRACQVEQLRQSLDNSHYASPDASQYLREGEKNDKTESKWATYTDNAEDADDKPEDDDNISDLDTFNRVVVGRAEQNKTKKTVSTAKPAQRKPVNPRVSSRNVGAAVAATRPPPQQPQPASVRHMPYKRPESHADLQSNEKSSIFQAVTSVAQKERTRSTSAATTTPNRSSEPTQPVRASNPRSEPAGSAKTPDMGECASTSKWSQFGSNDSDADSADDS